MSYDIEYARAAFIAGPDNGQFVQNATDGEKRQYQDLYVFHQIGCNNIEPRPRSWRLLASGWQYRVIQKVCELAGATEGGSLKFVNGDTTPENYLRIYRKLIKDAVPLTVEAVKEKVGIYQFQLLIDPKKALAAKEALDYNWSRLTKLAMTGEGYEGWTRGADRYDMKVWQRPFETVDDLKMFADNVGLAHSLGGYAHIDSFNNK